MCNIKYHLRKIKNCWIKCSTIVWNGILLPSSTEFRRKTVWEFCLEKFVSSIKYYHRNNSLTENEEKEERIVIVERLHSHILASKFPNFKIVQLTLSKLRCMTLHGPEPSVIRLCCQKQRIDQYEHEYEYEYEYIQFLFT